MAEMILVLSKAPFLQESLKGLAQKRQRRSGSKITLSYGCYGTRAHAAFAPHSRAYGHATVRRSLACASCGESTIIGIANGVGY